MTKEKKETQEKITLSVSQEDKANLERLASKFGYTRGGNPNISGLLRAIAAEDIEIRNKGEGNEIIRQLLEQLLVLNSGNSKPAE